MILMPREEDLEKLTYEELLAEKNYIIRYITEFERDFDMKNLVWDCKPGPDVHYQVFLDYLGILGPMLSKKYNREYVFGDKNYYEEMKQKNKQTTSILSYNINNCSQKKVDTLFRYDTDILIVPEITWEFDIRLKKGYEMVWNGDKCEGNYPKGLGIIWTKGNSYVPAWYNEDLRFAIPLFYKDILIIAIWPTKKKEENNQTYLQLTEEIIKYYAPYFTGKTIIAGDFNLYYNEEKKNKDADLGPINDLLKSFGFTSVYHRERGIEVGQEKEATYYHQFKKEQPFFLDYTYSNFALKKYELLNWDKGMSDHVGQLFEV